VWLKPDPRSRSLSFLSSGNCTFLLGLSPPFWHGAQKWWLIMIVWDFVYSLPEPDFRISKKAITWLQTLRNVDITRISNGHISVLRVATVTWSGTLVAVHVQADVTLDRSKVKVKVTGLLKFQKSHFSRSISSAISAWSSKAVVEHDNTGPSLQLVRAVFSNFLLRKLSCHMWVHSSRMSIVHEFEICLRLRSHGQACW